MRILFGHPGSELYGSDRMAVGTVKALIESGHQVTVVIPEEGPLQARFVETGATVRVIQLPVLRKALLRPRALLALIVRMPRTLGLSRRLILRERADVVFANTITQPWWLLAAKLTRRRAVVHVREAETEIPVIAQRILLAPLSVADIAIANSEYTRAHVMARGIGMRKKTTVIYNGKDWAPYFRSAFAGTGIPAQLLFIGRLNPRKGPDVAIRALKCLIDWGVDARLTLVGSVFPGYEWYSEELRGMVVELGLEEKVHFAGFQSDAAPFLDQAHIVVVPSRIEPFGTVAAEGMAAERPTIVSDVQGLVEIVSDRSLGRTFPVGDAQALAEVCRELIADDALAGFLAREGRRSVLQRFSTQTYGRRINEAVHSAAASRARRGNVEHAA